MDYKLTQKSQDALSVAVRRAATEGNPQVEPVHLLVALLGQGDGTTAPLLEAVGADPKALRRVAEEQLAALPKAAGATVASPQLSRPMLVVLNTASNRAKQLEDEYVSTEHLLVGLAADGGTVATLLKDNGAGPDALLDAFEKVRGSRARDQRQP